MTKDSDLQLSPSRRPTRERIGFIVNGTNAATAIKTILMHPVHLKPKRPSLHQKRPAS